MGYELHVRQAEGGVIGVADDRAPGLNRKVGGQQLTQVGPAGQGGFEKGPGGAVAPLVGAAAAPGMAGPDLPQVVLQVEPAAAPLVDQRVAVQPALPGGEVAV